MEGIVDDGNSDVSDIVDKMSVVTDDASDIEDGGGMTFGGVTDDVSDIEAAVGMTLEGVALASGIDRLLDDDAVDAAVDVFADARGRDRPWEFQAKASTFAGHFCRAARRRYTRHSAKATKQLQEERVRLAGTATALNRHAIRVGELAVADSSLRRLPDDSIGGNRTHATCPRSRVYLPEAILRLAFARLGQLTGRRQRQYHHELDFAACVSLCHSATENQFSRTSRLAITSGAREVSWMSKQSALDTTPIKVHFGKLADLLKPVCKYYWRNTSSTVAVDQQKWVKLSHEEYKARGMSREPYSGSIDMCAQRHSVVYASREVGHRMATLRRADPLIKPVFTGEDNSGILWKMLETGFPGFSWGVMVELVEYIPLIEQTLQGDLDACNNRMKMHAAELARTINDKMRRAGKRHRILTSDLPCLAHVLHTLFETTFKSPQLIPKLHATAVSFGHTTFYEGLLSSLA